MVFALHLLLMQSAVEPASIAETWVGLVLASAAVSAVVSGAIQIWVVRYHAKQHVKRRYEDVIAERRIEGCRKLLELVLKADHAVQPVRILCSRKSWP